MQASRSTLQEKKKNDKSIVNFPIIDLDVRKIDSPDKKEEVKE